MWPYAIVIATVGGLLASILFYRKMEARRAKKYAHASHRQEQEIRKYTLSMPRPEIMVMIPEGCVFEIDLFAEMQKNLLSHAQQLGNDIAQKVYRQGDDGEAQVVG